MGRNIFILVITLIASGSFYLYGNNLVANPGLEEGTALKIPYQWSTHIHIKDEGATEWEWLSTGAYRGKRAIFINNSEANDTRFYQSLPIQDAGKYQFSCWLKAGDIISEGGAGAGISLFNRFDTVTLVGTQENWQQITMYVKVAKGVYEIQIAFGIGGFGSLCKGKAWFDEIVFEKVDDFPEGANVVQIGSDRVQPEKIDFKVIFVLGINVALVLAALLITGLYRIKKRRT